MYTNKSIAGGFSSFIRVILVILGLVSLSNVADAKSFKEAEETAKHFARALNQFDVTNMVNEFHSDVHKYFYILGVRILETTEPAAEKDELLKMFGVKSPDEFKRLSPKTMTERFFKFAFSNYVPKPARDASLNSKITIVGSLEEKDIVYVLYRTETELKDKELEMQMNIPSLVALKLENGKYKVVSTTQLESIKSKFQSIIDQK
jgi:hypothetical protein